MTVVGDGVLRDILSLLACGSHLRDLLTCSVPHLFRVCDLGEHQRHALQL
jgi:hypothetical protein